MIRGGRKGRMPQARGNQPDGGRRQRTSFSPRRLNYFLALIPIFACGIILFGLLAPTVGYTADRYVKGDTGSDTGNDCTDPDSPCQTITRAESVATEGDTIHVYGGLTYSEQVNISGVNNLTFRKRGCSGANPLVSYSAAHAVLIGAQYVTWDSIDVTSGTGSAKDGINIDTGVSNVTILNSTIYECGRNAIIVKSPNCIIRNCTMYGNAGDRAMAIKAEATSTTIENCIIRDNYDEGIVIEGTNVAVISNNTIDGNGTGTTHGDGIKINSGQGTGNRIYNNIISNNSGYGIQDLDDTPGTNDPDEDYNCLYNNDDANYWGFNPGDHTMGGDTLPQRDPQFVDRTNKDFHLESTYGYYPFGASNVSSNDSPCIDAGQPSGDHSAYSEEPENNGNRVNMGAYGNTYQASLSGEASFSRGRTITIDHNQVGLDNSSDSLSNFPVLINISGDTNLKYVGYGGHVYSISGWDIIFRDSDAQHHLYHEIEHYDPCTGDLVAWVKIPDLPMDTDTVIWMHYGLPTIANKTELPNQVWHTDDGWRGVWHLGESSGQALDSTSDPKNGTVSGTVTQGASGQIDGAYDFDGSVSSNNPTVNFGDHDKHEFGTGSFTVGLWLYIENATSLQQIVFYKGASASWDAGYNFNTTSSSATDIRFSLTDVNGYQPQSPTASITQGEWTYLVGVVDRSSNRLRIYKDGTQV